MYEVQYGDSTAYLDSTKFAAIPASQKNNIISSKIIVERGEMLTMDDVEAYRFGFSRKSVRDFNEMLSELGLENAEVIRIQESWSLSFARLISLIAPFLIMIGFAALYIEFVTPGFAILFCPIKKYKIIC